MAYQKKTKKVKRTVQSVIAHIQSTFNNTIVSITTPEGDVLLKGSAGQLAKGARKGTPFSATQIGNSLAKDMLDMGIKDVEVKMKGPGSGRDSVVRSFQTSGLHITSLSDVTPLPHNGTRSPKKRRV